jgi:hypothetical protein
MGSESEVPPERSPFDHDGAYLDPAWLFTEGISLDQADPALSDALREFAAEKGMRIAAEATVAGRQLLVTHGSGLFVQATSVVGRDGYGTRERNRDRRDAARVCNLLVCELGLEGVIARPFTPDDMCGALREGEQALIWVAGGIKQVRSWATQAVLQGRGQSLSTIHWPVADAAVLETALGCTRASLLAAVAEPLPDFVASALMSRYWERPAEVVLFAWIVAEQLVNTSWKQYIDEVARSAGHRDRLKDFRTYTAAVQIDTLQADDRISPLAADSLHRARKRRNELAHAATLHTDAVEECITAMGDAMVQLAGVALDTNVEEWRQVQPRRGGPEDPKARPDLS